MKLWTELTLSTVTPSYFGRFPVRPSGRRAGSQTQEIPFPVGGLRGVLAYWLRALSGPHLGDSAELLLKAESEVFGEAANDGTGRPSRILLRSGRITVSSPPEGPAPGEAYLMGPGLIKEDEQGHLARRFEPANLPVKVRNLGRPEHADLFLSALWALCTFGGIGARSRRGMGTLTVHTVPELTVSAFDPAWLIQDEQVLPQVLDCVRAALTTLGLERGPEFAAEPGYPCFLEGHCTFATDHLSATNLNGALNEVGNLLRDFRHLRDPDPRFREDPKRSYLRANTAGLREVGRRFRDDLLPLPKPFVDGALGLPIGYTELRDSEPVTVEPLADGKPARRASPLWLRITRDPQGWVLRSLAFHSTWLPAEDVTLRVKMKGRSEQVTRPAQAEVTRELQRWFPFVKGRLSPQG